MSKSLKKTFYSYLVEQFHLLIATYFQKASVEAELYLGVSRTKISRSVTLVCVNTESNFPSSLPG